MKPRQHRRLQQSPRIWTEIINNIKNYTEKAVDNISEIVEKTIDVIDKLLAFGDNIETYEFPATLAEAGDTEVFVGEGAGVKLRELISKPAVGIDSSISRPVRIGHRYYAIVDAAMIRHENIYEREPKEKIWARLAEAPDAADPAHAKIELNLAMFHVELEAIREAAAGASYGTLVFIDGPIIDPPAPPSGDGLQAVYQKYLEDRAKAIRSIVEKGGLPVGVVKRVRGSLIVQQLAEILQKEGRAHYADLLRRYRIGDYSFALYASLALRYVAKSRQLVPVLRPVEVHSYAFIKQGVRVLTFLMVPRLPGVGSESKPLRVEVALPLEADTIEATMAIKKAAAAIAAWLVPGLNVPRPILLAHTRCTIRDRDSQRLLKEILSRSLYYMATRRLSSPAPDTIAAIA